MHGQPIRDQPLGLQAVVGELEELPGVETDCTYIIGEKSTEGAA